MRLSLKIEVGVAKRRALDQNDACLSLEVCPGDPKCVVTAQVPTGCSGKLYT